MSSVELPELRGRVRIDTAGVDKASKSIGKAGVAVGAAMGTLAAGAISKAADAVVGFATESVGAFSKVGKEVIGVGRLFGLTAEDASRLRFAAQQSGIGFDQLKVGLRKFSKEALKSDGALKDLGVSAKDAAGKNRPLDDVLLDVSDKFKNMPNGAAKSAAAMELFGKSGLDMLPMLGKGSAELNKLKGEADEFGQVLGEKDVQAVKDNIGAQRRWQAALQGAQLQLGRVLLPIMTKFAEAFTIIAIKARPVVEFIAKGISRLITVITPFLALGWGVVADALGAVGAAFAKVFGDAEKGSGPLTSVKDNVMSLSETIKTNLLPIWEAVKTALIAIQPSIVALGQAFVTTIMPALIKVGAFLIDYVVPAWMSLQRVLVTTLLPVISRIVQVVVSTLIPVWTTLANLFIQNVLPALQSLFAEFQANVLPVLQRVIGIVGKVITIFVTFIGAIVRTVLPPLLRFIGPILGALITVLGKVIGWVFKAIGFILDIGAAVGEAGGAIGRFVTGALGKVEGLWTFFKELPGKIIGKMATIGTTLLSAGGDLIKGFITGIKNKAGDIITTIKTYITDKLPDFVKKALGIASPSKVFMRLGAQVSAGMAAGIRSGGADVARAADALTAIPNARLGSVAIGAAAASSAGGAPLTNITVNATGAAAQTPYAIAREIAWQQRTVFA